MEAVEEQLIEQVKEIRKEYKTDSYSMSVGEITNLYRDGEIVINPDFQRLFRWNIAQKSRLIESILLGIPIPSIFVYQNEAGLWELVDGLQRVSTILEFMGLLKDKNGEQAPPSSLKATKALPQLEGVTWNTLPQSLRLEIKRTKIKVEIILNDSDKDAKFEVFQRLNTGGSFLTEQEIRNALLILMNKPFYIWLKELAQNENFQNSVNLSERALQSEYDTELVLRYLAYSHFEYHGAEVSDFLTQSAERLARAKDQDFNYKNEKAKFEKVFALLNQSLGENAFRKFKGDSFGGQFLVSAFEAIAIGLSLNVDEYDQHKDVNLLADKVKEIWNHPEFVSNMGSGSNAAQRVPRLVEFGRQYFKK